MPRRHEAVLVILWLNVLMLKGLSCHKGKANKDVIPCYHIPVHCSPADVISLPFKPGLSNTSSASIFLLQNQNRSLFGADTEQTLLRIQPTLDVNVTINQSLSKVLSSQWNRLVLNIGCSIVKIKLNEQQLFLVNLPIATSTDPMVLHVGNCSELRYSSWKPPNGSPKPYTLGSITKNGIRVKEDVCHSLTEDAKVGRVVRRSLIDPGRMDAAMQPIYVADPTEVVEGGTTRLEWLNLYVFPQHKRYNIDNSDVLFTLTERPKHGKLTLDNELVNGLPFTYDDILRGRVNYTHDGSETREDVINVEVLIRNLPEEAPEELKEEHSYDLRVRIFPVNDPPEMRLPNGGVVRLAENSRSRIGRDILSVADPDDSTREVRINVRYLSPTGGYFEREHNPGQRIDSFSLDELLGERVRLAHHGQLRSQLEISVSDGKNVSMPQIMRVEAFPIKLRMVTNTGLSVVHNSFAVLHSDNLTFASNVDTTALSDQGQRERVKYTLVDMPQYGFIKLETTRGTHQITSTFDQEDIDNGRVIYNHTPGTKPVTDTFRFQTTVGNTTSPIVYNFVIKFIPVNIKVFNPSPFLLNNTQELTLTREHLFAWTFPKNAAPQEMMYHVTKSPKYGFVYRRISRMSGRNRRIGLYSNFTQRHIDDGDMFYRLHFTHYTIVNDHFTFKVAAPFVSSESMRFDITFLPGQDGIHLINRTFVVAEGTLQLITNNTLFLETPDDSDFLFTVGVAPSNGAFHLSLSTGGRMSLKTGDNFTTQDLLTGRLWYLHDDSESTDDKAYLIARPLYRRAEEARIPFWFTVQIVLQNDHKPQRRNDMVFQVVDRGDGFVTKADLEYWDEDSDMDSADLRYVFPNDYAQGGFYNRRITDVPVHNFTQRDINQDRLIFRHVGTQRQFTLPFTVTDGHHVTDGTFVVNASKPFLSAKVNSGIVVNKGEVAVIGPNNITIYTNLNIRPDMIKIEVPPTTNGSNADAGKFMVVTAGNERGERRNIFTQKDINDHRVLYADDGTSTNGRRETITARVYAVNLQIWMDINIVVLSSRSARLLTLNANKPLVVTVGGLAQIDDTRLHAEHPTFSARSLVYAVVKPPTKGSLILDTPATRPMEQWGSEGGQRNIISPSNFFVRSFTQLDIDSGSVQYLHDTTDGAPNSDTFEFNVTAGQNSIGPFIFHIDIVVDRIILTIKSNLSVKAGEKTKLTPAHLHTESTFFNKAEMVFEVVDKPVFGWIEAPNRTAVDKFTSTDLANGLVSYAHSGRSFSWKDNFTLVASLMDNFAVKSKKKTVFMDIVRDNLRAPELVENNALQMWSSRVSTITPDLLKVVDRDTKPNDVLYLITSPTNGYVAYISLPTNAVYNFSQADIDSERVGFIRYENGTSGGFSFVVSDGLHQIGPDWFTVDATDVHLALEVNDRLLVGPGSDKVIGMGLLNTHIPLAEPPQIVYLVVKPPKKGVLLLRGQPTDAFTQFDVNQRHISYRQTSSDRPSTWIAKDAFSFTLRLNGTRNQATSPALDEERRFRIIITYAALDREHMDEYVKISPLTLPESGSMAVNATHVNIAHLDDVSKEPLVLRVVREPQLGVLEFDGRNWTEDATALQILPADLNTNSLIYHHFGRKTSQHQSAPQDDDISFDVFPATEPYTKRRNLRLRISLPIHIAPRTNKLLKVISIPSVFHFVRGTQPLLEAKHFQVEYAAKSPSDVNYNVIQGPIGGKIVMEAGPVTTFTQADINRGRVRLIHNGKQDGSTVTFRIGTTDGTDAITRVVQVHVKPLSLSLVNLTRIDYRQGTTYMVLNKTHMGTDSNGPTQHIVYNVTVQPKNGTFYWVAGEKKTSVFTQKDINEGRVLYAQLNMLSYQDAFEFIVSNEQNQIRKQLEIKVLPAVIQKPVSVSPGGFVVINSEILDASQLEGKSPRFFIIQHPKYGQLIVEKGQRRERAAANIDQSTNGTETPEKLSFFTYHDVKKGWLRYESTLMHTHGRLMDSFEYELQAHELQPARGVFEIEVRSSTTTDRQPVEADDKNVDLQSTDQSPPSTKKAWLPSMTDAIAFPVFVLILLIIMACIFVFIRKTRIGRERERRFVKEKQQQLLASKPMLDLPQSTPDLLGSTVYASVGQRATSLRHSTPIHVHEESPAPPPPLMGPSSSIYDYGVVMHSSLTEDHGHCRPSPIRPNLITFDPSRAELLTSSVPTCKVTPLTNKYGGLSSTVPTSASGSSEEYWKGAYHYSSSASDTDLKTDRLSLDHTTGHKQVTAQKQHTSSQPIIRSGSLKPPTKLKENQYWV